MCAAMHVWCFACMRQRLSICGWNPKVGRWVGRTVLKSSKTKHSLDIPVFCFFVDCHSERFSFRFRRGESLRSGKIPCVTMCVLKTEGGRKGSVPPLFAYG